MPCMGPSMPEGLAEKITDEVLAWLHEHHHIGAGNGLDQPNGKFQFRDQYKLKLLEAVKELVWDDICQSF